MLPHHPLFRRFENELNLSDERYEWTTRGDDLFIRPKEASPFVVWTMLGRGDLARQLAGARDETVVPAPLKIFQTVRGRFFWRFWLLKNGEECFLRKRCGLLRVKGELVRFDFLLAFDHFSRAKPQEIASLLGSCVCETEAARRWGQMSQHERINQLVTVEGGTYEQLTALISSAFVLCEPRHGSYPLQLNTPGKVSLQLFFIWGQTRLDSMLKVLSHHFSLKTEMQLWRGCDSFGDPIDVPCPEFSSGETSHHEKLEALLVWRDFLRDKLPPDEIEALLQPFSR